MADVKILEKARTSFLQEDDLFFINQNNALRQVPIKVVAEKTAGALPEATADTAGTMTAQDKKNLTSLVEDHAQGITPAQKVDFARYTAVEVMNNLLTYIKQIPPGGCQKLNLGVGNTAAFVGYWNNNDDTTVLLAGAWSALEVIGVCFDSDQAYAKLRLTSYNSNKTYECTLKADVFTPWEVGGTVKSVNNTTPDSDGNIQIEIETGGVKSINGMTPDESGNLQIKALEADGYIKTINGEAVDIVTGGMNLSRGKTLPINNAGAISYHIEKTSGTFVTPGAGVIYMADAIENRKLNGFSIGGGYHTVLSAYALVVGMGDVFTFSTPTYSGITWYPFAE